MEEYKLINNTSNIFQETYSEVKLHEDILNILFKHKKEVCRKLADLQGLFLLDHIAIKIIDPKNKIVIFSLTPSVEYNLIVQGLWKFDYGFSSSFHQKNTFYRWEKAYDPEYYDEIKYLKEYKHDFTFGFNISKKIESFRVIYSYATRSKNAGLYEYYFKNIATLSALGDYGYKLLNNIYVKYSDNKTPEINSSFLPSKPFLKLIKSE